MNGDKFIEWKGANYNDLISGWMETLPPEDLPLDDDLADFLDNNYEDFDMYCKGIYEAKQNAD